MPVVVRGAATPLRTSRSLPRKRMPGTVSEGGMSSMVRWQRSEHVWRQLAELHELART